MQCMPQVQMRYGVASVVFYMIASTHRKEFALTCAKCIQHNMRKSTVNRWILRPICFQDHPRSIAYIQNPIGSQKPANSQRLMQFAAHFMVIQAETSVAEHVVLFVVAIKSIIEHSLTGCSSYLDMPKELLPRTSEQKSKGACLSKAYTCMPLTTLKEYTNDLSAGSPTEALRACPKLTHAWHLQYKKDTRIIFPPVHLRKHCSTSPSSKW